MNVWYVAFICEVTINTSWQSLLQYRARERRKEKNLDNGDEPFGPADIIEMQINYLMKKYGSDLRASHKVYRSYQIDD